MLTKEGKVPVKKSPKTCPHHLLYTSATLPYGYTLPYLLTYLIDFKLTTLLHRRRHDCMIINFTYL